MDTTNYKYRYDYEDGERYEYMCRNHGKWLIRMSFGKYVHIERDLRIDINIDVKIDIKLDINEYKYRHKYRYRHRYRCR